MQKWKKVENKKTKVTVIDSDKVKKWPTLQKWRISNFTGLIWIPVAEMTNSQSARSDKSAEGSK